MDKHKTELSKLLPGEHVAAFWFASDFQWYLGVIDDINEGVLFVSYMIRASDRNVDWVFPETAEVFETSFEQIMARRVPVEYQCSVRIRCTISSQELISEFDTKVTELNTPQNIDTSN